MEGKYYAEELQDAYEVAVVVGRLKKGMKGSLGMPILCFFHSLTHLAKFDKLPDEKLLVTVRENQEFMKWWTDNCQINGRQQYPFAKVCWHMNVAVCTNSLFYHTKDMCSLRLSCCELQETPTPPCGSTKSPFPSHIRTDS